MTRVKIFFPQEQPLFTCTIPIRITDINYGNHLANDAVLSILHEARMQLLASWGFSEMNAAGTSLIMGDVMIAYRSEAFYGEVLQVDIYCGELAGRSFALLYNVKAERSGRWAEVAHAKTGMVCFDYTARKPTAVTEVLKSRLLGE